MKAWKLDNSPSSPPAAEFGIRRDDRRSANREDTWRENSFSAEALQTMTFKPVDYVVPGIFPEGVTILAGKPKIGKSWLALDIALAVSGDRFLLGEIKPIQGAVLYAALEDNKRRLWKRIRKIMAAADVRWPSGLTLATRWRRLDNGGVADIQDWAATVANPRLVILDTLAGVRPDRNARETIYEGNYKALRDLHAWSNEAGIAVLVLTHQRKLEAGRRPYRHHLRLIGPGRLRRHVDDPGPQPEGDDPLPSWPGRRRARARGHVQRRNLQMDHPGRRR